MMNNVVMPEVFHGLGDFFKGRKERENQRERQFRDERGVIDFERNERSARIWGRHNFERAMKRLTIKEKRELHAYGYTSKSVNSYLKNKDQIVENLSKEFSKREIDSYRKSYDTHIETIEKALAKSKTDKDFYVYIKTDENQFSPKVDVTFAKFQLRHNNQLSPEVVERIQKEFIDTEFEYKEPGFISASLTIFPENSPLSFFDSPPTSKEELLPLNGHLIRLNTSESKYRNPPVLVKIKVPAGTNGLYVRELLDSGSDYNEVLIGRNQTLKYKKITQIAVNGFPTLLVDLDLIPSD